MKPPDRTFETVHAEPGARPLWIGLMGPSGGGKTFSALLLAKGIQSVMGGRINFVDTESGRGLHYADLFDYDYTPFAPPHGSLDYLKAIEHAHAKGGRIITIDSFSHEHEGEGGLIEFHEAEVDRLSRGDAGRAEAVKMLAWTRPKEARKQLLRAMLRYGTGVTFILCFRADEQSKPVKKASGKTEVVQMGFMPIAGKPFVYEATVCALLMPGANGVPTWEPENVGEKMMRKLPEQFKGLFESTKGQPLSVNHGRALAEWAQGGTKAEPKQPPAEKSIEERVAALKAELKKCSTKADVDKLWERAKKLRADLLKHPDAAVLEELTLSFEGRATELEGE